MDITVDTRESNKSFVSNFIIKAREKGHTIEESALDFGDLKCGDIVVERKEINDFASSATSSRLWDQILKMKENPSYTTMFVVSGDVSKLNFHNKNKIPEIYGATAKIMRLGISIHFVENDTVLTTHVLNMLEQSIDIDIPIKKVKKIDGKSIVRSFPGVGKKSMDYIKTKFDTVLDFLSFVTYATEKDIQSTFGKAKGTRIFNALKEKL